MRGEVSMDERNDKPQRFVHKKKKKPGHIRRVFVLVLSCVIFFGAGKATGSIVQAVAAMMAGSEISKNDVINPVVQEITDANEEATIEQNNSKKDASVDADDWKLILVNPWNKLPDNYSVKRTVLNNGHSVDERAYPDLQEMMDDARAEGLSPIICSSFRTIDRQKKLFDEQVNRYIARGYSTEKAKKEAAKWVAVPGTSEHHTGLAVDIVALSYQHLDEAQENTAEQQWLMQNAYQYGFILRYPSNKSDITGIGYEPWHYRYVGKEAAKEIYERNLCLEEYLGKS